MSFADRMLRCAVFSFLLLPLGIALPTLAAEDEQAGSPAETSEEQPADPFAVPDGDAAELVEFIDKVARLQPQERTPEAIQEFGGKLVAALQTAADRILAAEATDQQLQKAVEAKYQSLKIAGYLGDASAGDKRQKFFAEIRKDGRDVLLRAIRPLVLVDDSQRWRNLDEGARVQFLREVVEYLKTSEIGRNELGLVQQIGQALESSGDPVAAAGFYQAIIPVFAANSNPQVSALAERFTAVARRLGLVGNEMELEGTTLDGSEFKWSDWRGKVVLVDFWATWCGPCLRELPNIEQNYAAYHGKGFEVVGISLDPASSREKVEAFVERRAVPWTILFSDDEEKSYWNHPMATYYGIDGIPAMMLVGKDGKVLTLSARGSELGRYLQELLGDPLAVEE